MPLLAFFSSAILVARLVELELLLVLEFFNIDGKAPEEVFEEPEVGTDECLRLVLACFARSMRGRPVLGTSAGDESVKS
jgi:hypothetical protein